MPKTESKPEHTPGPWKYERNLLRDVTKLLHYEVTSGTRAFWIAHVLCFDDSNDGTEYEANARLIAAAPQLLGALEAIMRAVRQGARPYGPAIDRAEAALRAARPQAEKGKVTP